MRSILLSAVFIAVAVVCFYRNTACVKFIRVFFICAVKVFIDKNLTGNDARLELYLSAGQGVVTLIPQGPKLISLPTKFAFPSNIGSRRMLTFSSAS